MQLTQKAIGSNKRVVITRRLPTPGEVLVKRGQKVQALEVIARTEVTQRYHVVDVARQLAQSELDMNEVMLKGEGATVKANEIIAAVQGGLTLLRRVAKAPAAGRIAAIGPGWVLLETKRQVIELQAFGNGVISKIIPNRGAVIEAKGSIITATCGFGGEAFGLLKRLVNAPFESLQPEAIDERAKGAILLGGRSINEEVLRVAEGEQVKGIIVGSIDASLMDLAPLFKVRVVVTEGFGNVMMSPFTFGVLGTIAGQEVSIRGTTPAGVREADELPVVLSTSIRISSQSLLASAEEEVPEPIPEVGSRVRISRGRLLGASGVIDSIPPKAQAIESGVVAPGAQVMIDGVPHYIPWANLDLIY